MKKMCTIDTCWFSRGDIVLVREPGFRERYAVVRSLEEGDLVCVGMLMTGRSVFAANWRNASFNGSGFVERHFPSSSLEAVCRCPQQQIGSGDLVVVFPIVHPPHSSVIMRVVSDEPHNYVWGRRDISVQRADDLNAAVMLIESGRLYFPADQLDPISVGDSVMVNHGPGKRQVSVVRGINGNGHLDLAIRCAYSVNYAMGDVTKLSSKVCPLRAMTQSVPIEVDLDWTVAPRLSVISEEVAA